MIAIPNIDKPKSCWECFYSQKCEHIPRWLTDEQSHICATRRLDSCPLIEIVRCGECKHRPIKDDPDGADYGFNIVAPTDGDDVCPCLVEDGWYSWMPEDNFYCGRGERRK